MKTFIALAAFASLALVSAQETQQCGKNEYFSPSTCNGCDFTCKHKEAVMCTAMCRPPKCMCKPGFYRNDQNECVSASECPAEKVLEADTATTCGKNEVFSPSWCNGCDRTCAEGDHPICKALCQPPKCMCKDGFYRNAGNECVVLKDCAKKEVFARSAESAHKCGTNEHFANSNCNGCDRTCAEGEHTICPAMCYPPKCMCNPGFYRNKANECVALKDCAKKEVFAESAPQCGENEYFSPSTCNGCDMNCFERDHTICLHVCYPPKCMCKPGFYRDTAHRCVAPQRCPAVQPPVYPTKA